MSRGASRRSRRIIFLGAALAIFLILLRWLVLPAAGNYLVLVDEPAKAEAAVVLAGDNWGNRVLRGAELRRDGLVDAVYVSGGPSVYGNYESELAIRFAGTKGFPPEYFVGLHDQVSSTEEEAYSIVSELRRRGIRSILLVTSDYHTRRSGRIWRHTAPWMNLRVIAARDHSFHREYWWRDREAGKVVLNEWAKLVAFTIDFFPPVRSGPVPPPDSSAAAGSAPGSP